MAGVFFMLWAIFVVVIISEIVCYNGNGMENVIGESVDIFANYGDLSQMMQVISSDVDDDLNPIFSERTLKVFENSPTETTAVDTFDSSITFQFCDSFDQLMDNYYSNFEIEGTDKPWKSFMGDWYKEEILRSLGVTNDQSFGTFGYCCFVLARMSKIQESVTSVGDTKNYSLTRDMADVVKTMNASDDIDVRRFMRSYGTHYISSYSTGDSVYQVFVYTPLAYRSIKKSMRHRRQARLSSEDLRYFTSSFFLRQIGQVMVASGNKTIERWCEEHLKDGHFLYTRPTLLRLYNNSTLLGQMSHMLENSAILGMTFTSLAPIFGDGKRERFNEMVDNDLKLWEVTI